MHDIKENITEKMTENSKRFEENLSRLEDKQDKHNSVIERQFLLEKNIGFPYGTGDIESLLRAAIFHRNGKQKDRPGLICSEYIALCSEDIQKFCNLPAWCITPAHFQHYIDTKGIKAEGRENEN